MKSTLRLLSFLAVTSLATVSGVTAQSFPLASAELADSARPATMRRLAEQVIAVYHDADRRKELDNLFRLQIVAGRYDEASRSLAALRALRGSEAQATAQSRAANIQYEIYARARALEAADGRPFAETFAQAFREILAGLEDRTSALVLRSFGANRPALQDNLSRTIRGQEGKTEIALADALALLRHDQIDESYRAFAPLAEPLIAEEDGRRYVIERDVPVKTPDGATSCVLVVRPRSQQTVPGRLPALLEFTIYADPVSTLNEARRSASNGYAGVEALARGKGCSPDKPVPYEHDGSDAAAVIDWISRQPWSDARVGMFGGSYNGFTQWAAAKHRPKALKALMPSVTVAPGIDVPMDGNLFLSFVYPWTFYTANGKGLDDATYNDFARWNKLRHDWYVSGQAYRAMDRIDGTPNPIFDRWLDHPTYDAYWQGMIPYQKEFARIDIPVLTTTGYYDDGQIGALYYFAQHFKYNPKAEHYLLIGPYDHVRGQRGTVSFLGDPLPVLNGYATDPVAQIDIGELRYQWFDSVFKGGPRPALLQDKVNYQVMGANQWKHAPSVAAMGPRRRRFHFSAERSGEAWRLIEGTPPRDASIPLTVDLADRSDADRPVPSGGIVDKEIDTAGGLVFVSDPFQKPIEFSGLFSGRLELVTNKRDLDFDIHLYERTPAGEYVQLSYYWARASHVGDRGHRRLLAPGQRQRLDFESGRLISRRFEPGSRLVLVLSVVKQPNAQINYGTGKDVSDETVADAGEPLMVRWLGGSYLEIPVAE
jgi:putative CocE/NonD family hydrolase